AMTNFELQEYVLKFISELRTFNDQKRTEDRLATDKLWREKINASKEKQQDMWQKEQSEYTARHMRVESEYNARFRGTALSLRDELRKRIPGIAKSIESDRRQQVLLDHGMFAGPDPIGEAADYLDQLARGLPVN
ncbi:MAG: hypothetical protein IH628_03095, partial [Proteobacteria bacterium]|nr:hypothetical protein [Pseudomonadota bacterium]